MGVSMKGFASAGPGFAAGVRVPTRPMTEAEQQQLQRALRSPKIMVPRFVGILTGIGGLFLAVTFFAGFPYDPSTFVYEAPLVGFVGLMLAGAAAGASRDPRASLKRGEVVDITAPTANVPGAPRSLLGLMVGPWTLFVPARLVDRIRAGSDHRLVVATGLRTMPYPGYGRVGRGLLLSVNGGPLPSPPVVYFDPASVGVAPTPTASPTGVSGAARSLTSTPTPTASPGTAPAAYCPRCGADQGAPAQFCLRCGAPLPR
jgi:hypothetical protein